MFKVYSNYLGLQSCRFCATSVSVGPVMSHCLFSSVPTLSFICELNDGFEHVVNSLWSSTQCSSVHDFNILFIYLEHKIKKILALSLNWKVNFKLFNPEMGQNGSMYLPLAYGGEALW